MGLGRDANDWADTEHFRHPGPNGADDGLPYFTIGSAAPLLNDLWLIKGVLPRRGVAVIYGPSGGGKTFVATDMFVSVSRGVLWRNRKTKQTAVLYLAPDGGAAFANRLCAYRIHHGITDAPFFAVGCPVDLLGKINADDINKLETLIIKIEKEHDVEIGVIVVDTVSRAMPGGDENQPADMSRFIDNLGRIGGNGRLVVGIHHTPKGNATILRGHSSLDGAADCELNVNDGAIRVAKSRDGVGNETFGFHLQVVELGYDDDGDLVTSCVALATDDAPAKGRRTKLSDGAALALKALEKAIDEVGQPLPAGRHYPSSRSTPGPKNGTYRGCPVETWRTYFYSLKTGDRDTQKKAFQRAVDALQAAEIVAIWADVVWLTGHGT